MDGSPTILIVDDEAMLVSALSRVLRGQGIVVESAKNGVEALEKLRTNTYSLVICDLRMPIMDGAQLLAEVMKENLKKGPFIFLTGYSDYPRELLLALGADAVYSKPLEQGAIRDVVREWLGHRPPNAV